MRSMHSLLMERRKVRLSMMESVRLGKLSWDIWVAPVGLSLLANEISRRV